MNSIFRVQSSLGYGPKPLSRPLLHPIPGASRSASLNSAIDRGRRRSQGVGFRGKERPAEKRREDKATDARQDGGTVRRTADPQLAGARGHLSRDAWRQGRQSMGRSQVSGRQSNRSDGPVGVAVRIHRGKKDITATQDRPRLTRAARFNDPDFRFGKKSLTRGREGGRGDEEGRTSNIKIIREGGKKASRTLPTIGSSRSDVVDRHREVDVYRSDQPALRLRREVVPSEATATSDHRTERSRGTRIPVSIPYTTPASEFLYGTSVVEAALFSKRRKLYKLYIYSGEGRSDINVARDARLEQFAKKNGIRVENVDKDGLSLMDKLSKGRPHNGYLLEASPLPKLPIASLGKPTIQEGIVGFSVVLGHQSREEADINGTSNIIQLPHTDADRNPFILYLDSIKDPGNLGSIIRSASFLGITAVAISTSNSPGFTPVVLKASAGTAEAMTLLSVNNRRGFITDSRDAGWKIYAAVAPSSGGDKRGLVPFITTDQLDDGPLRQDPIILMLGDEGQGLSQHLRNKADVEVAIPSLGNIANVDSLNVSVAAGVLCHAFLRKGMRDSESETGGETQMESEDKDPATAEDATVRAERDLF